MGAARTRGSYAERKAAAIAAGRVKSVSPRAADPLIWPGQAVLSFLLSIGERKKAAKASKAAAMKAEHAGY